MKIDHTLKPEFLYFAAVLLKAVMEATELQELSLALCLAYLILGNKY